MATKFKGELDELKVLIASAGIEGNWKEEGGGKHSFKSKADGVLNWWPGTGTLQFQGQAAGKAALETALAGEAPAAAAVPAATLAKPQRQIFISTGTIPTRGTSWSLRFAG